MSTAYAYAATVTAVHDGDTLRVVADLGFHVALALDVRLDGINARELAAPGGPEARTALVALCPVGAAVTLSSLGLDKYGRCLGRVTLADGRDVSTALVGAGYAAPWNGSGVRPVPVWPRVSNA